MEDNINNNINNTPIINKDIIDTYILLPPPPIPVNSFLQNYDKYKILFDYENNNINKIFGENTLNKIIKDNYGEKMGI